MPDLWSFLVHLPTGSQVGTSQLTQAHMAIPTGTVHDKCQAFEARISAHQYEHDSVYISRAARNMKELLTQNGTYADRLRAAENVTLFEIPRDLVQFLRDHDNLYRAAIRNRSRARKAIASPNMDVREQVTHRLHNIRTASSLNLIETSHSLTERQRMMHDPVFASEFTECISLLQNEIVLQLIRVNALISATKDLELENIGPDHSIDDFGHDVPPPSQITETDLSDPSHRCCICLSPWTTTHAPFLITTCSHVVGRPCLARWLNSTARNANLCPCCRTALCERRRRKPKAVAVGGHEAISERLGRAIILLGEVGRMYGELFGKISAEGYMRKTVEDLNYRLFEGDVGFVMQYEQTGQRWGVRRVRWHRVG